MAQPLMTPGVYIEEKNAFPGSVVEVATAIPAFIGYTEKASRNGKSLLNIPTRITSFAEYVELFGGGFSPKFKVDKVGSSNENREKPESDFTEQELQTITKTVTDFVNGLGKSQTDIEKNELIENLTNTKKENLRIEKKKIADENRKELEGGIRELIIDEIKLSFVVLSEADPNPEPKKTVIPDGDIDIILKLVFENTITKETSKEEEKKFIKEAITKFKFPEKTKEKSEAPVPKPANDGYSFKIGKDDYTIEPLDNHKLLFYNSIKLFYSNGGGTCYIVSVGTYEGENGKKVDKGELLGDLKDGGLAKLKKEQEPTLVVIPEAVLLGENCYEVYKQILRHCGDMQNRFAIFDLHDGYEENLSGDGGVVGKFRANIGSDNLSYGAVYYPWLNTNIVEKGEVTFKNLDMNFDKLKETFLEPKAVEFFKKAKSLPPSDKSGKENAYKSSKDLDENAVIGELDLEIFIKNLENNFHMGLLATSPSYSALLDEVRNMINQMPAAPAMAGKYTAVDSSRGVWKAPANVSLNSVVSPMVNITHDQQENLNVDAVTGKSINAIRTFPGVGTLVWGARTLNGNSLDWQYINVRRTIIMLEQSIKLALRSYVFEPNDANTWITVKSMIVNFLTEKWKQGALAGSSPEDAFDVQIGLGATMTGLDILQGKMLVSVKLAIVRPAEFIVVTFQQQMQKS